MVPVHRVLVATLISVVLTVSPATASPNVARRAAMATHFIVSQQQPDGSIPALDDPIPWTADAVVSLVAARRAPKAIDRALDYLEASSDEIDSIGEMAKVVLAEVAGGRDPRKFVGRDLVAEIVAAQQSDGRYGAETSVFSHSIAMLALESADESSGLEEAAQWLLDAQCDNGGWQVIGPPVPGEDEHCSFGYPDIDEANSDTTSLAVQALEGLPDPIAPTNDPFVFLDSLIDEVNGGWSYDRPDSFHSNFTSKVANANSTGMVLQAYAVAEVKPARGSVAALAKLQGRLCGLRGGSFYYTWGDEDGDGTYGRTGKHNLAATIAAVPGLLLAELPQAPLDVTRHAPRARRC